MHLVIALLTSLLAAERLPVHSRLAAAPGPSARPAPAQTADEGGAPAKAPPAAPPAATIDVARLRAEYDKLRDALFRARARAELVEEGVYASKMGARIRWKGAPDFIMRRAEVRLDGNSIWDSGEKPLVDEIIKVSERPIKPGQHSVTLRLEIRPGKKSEKEHEGLGYEIEHSFVVNIPDGKRTTIDITADDDGDLPEYEPEIEVEIESEK
ncbi:MAG TPA: hypothetical protein VKQ32_17255 [Polyangia bacterium]|nr:hypothetical protein [Polyangia bacterium]